MIRKSLDLMVKHFQLIDGCDCSLEFRTIAVRDLVNEVLNFDGNVKLGSGQKVRCVINRFEYSRARAPL